MEERKKKGEVMHLDINLKVKYNIILFLCNFKGVSLPLLSLSLSSQQGGNFIEAKPITLRSGQHLIFLD